jgi:hypothetical protein
VQRTARSVLSTVTRDELAATSCRSSVRCGRHTLVFVDEMLHRSGWYTEVDEK